MRSRFDVVSQNDLGLEIEGSQKQSTDALAVSTERSVVVELAMSQTSSIAFQKSFRGLVLRQSPLAWPLTSASLLVQTFT
jgi:hypothetical protein